MATPGEVTYQVFISKLIEKANSRYISVHNVQQIGTGFWRFMSDEFKDRIRESDGRKAFWNFALNLKEGIVNQNFGELFELWNNFDNNAKNLFENLYNNCILYHVNKLFS